jgi:ABC-type transport system involved in multi-copper enzyme maturation permease subunit
MWTLLRREIEDQAILFVLVLIAGIVFAGWMAGAFPSVASVFPTRVPMDVYGVCICLLLTLSVGGGALAGLQIAGDRGRGVSRFLCTLTATRSQILLAKWIAGLLWLVLGMVPTAVVCAILAHRWIQFIPIDTSPIVSLISGTGLLALASYALGMQAAMASRPVWVVIGSVVSAGGLIGLVVIKGFGLHTHVLAGAVATACLVRTWIQFRTVAL